MDHTLKTSETISVTASKKDAWDAIINPVKIAQYLYGTETISDWKVGSEIIFQGKYEEWTYKDKGIIQRFSPEDELVYTYWAQFNNLDDEPENYSLVSIKIDAGKTDDTVNISWNQVGYKDQTTRDRSQGGLKDLLERMKKTIEG